MPATHLNGPIQNAGVTDVTLGYHGDGYILPSLARIAATYTTPEVFSPDCKGLRVYVDITNHNGGSVSVTLQTKDPVSGNWVSTAATTATPWSGANQTRTLTLYPGITVAAGGAAANVEVSQVLDISWRLSIVVATATVTFSVGAVQLL